MRKIRETMWGGVETRSHNPEKVYHFSDDAQELMLHGTVSEAFRPSLCSTATEADE